MEGEKLERRERDFENARGRHVGEIKRKYASGGAGASQVVLILAYKCSIIL